MKEGGGIPPLHEPGHWRIALASWLGFLTLLASGYAPPKPQMGGPPAV